jgi:hypothetical protein
VVKHIFGIDDLGKDPIIEHLEAFLQTFDFTKSFAKCGFKTELLKLKFDKKLLIKAFKDLVKEDLCLIL